MNKPQINQKSEESAKKTHVFWVIYACSLFILSLGCVAGDQNPQIGQIGVCGTSAERWAEARGEAGYLGFYHSITSGGMTSRGLNYSFNPFLLKGSLGTYYVSHWDTGEPARIKSVTSSNPNIIAVAPIHQSNQTYFDVEALQPGTTEIVVHTQLGASDRIVLAVTNLDHVQASHCCTFDNRAMYLTNTEIEIPVTYFSSYGETPIGFGRLPFNISNQNKLEWLPGVPDPADIHLLTGLEPGVVTLDPVVSGDPLTLELVDPDQLDGISVHINRDDTAYSHWFVGAVLYRDDMPVCAGKYPLRLTSLTPDICWFITADYSQTSRIEIAGDQVADMSANYNNDDCKLRVELLGAHGDVLLKTEISHEFLDSSSSSSSGGFDD